MNDNPSTAAVPAEAPAPAARRPARVDPEDGGPALARAQPRAAAPGLAVGAAHNPSTAVAAETPRLAPAYRAAEERIAQSPGAPQTPRQAMRQLNQATMALALRHH